MAKSPFFSGRVPKVLFDRINARIKDTGETKTEILVNALAKYLEIPIEELESKSQTGEEVIIEDLENLKKSFQEIKNTVNNLSKTVESLSIRIEQINNKQKESIEKVNTNQPKITSGQLKLFEKNSDTKQETNSELESNLSEQREVLKDSFKYSETKLSESSNTDRNKLRKHRLRIIKDEIEANIPIIVYIYDLKKELPAYYIGKQGKQETWEIRIPEKSSDNTNDNKGDNR